MTTQTVGTLLVYAVAPAANLLPLLYSVMAPWHRVLAGWALMFSKVGLALLVDAALLFHLHGDTNYRYHDQLVLFAFALIGIGTYLYLVAFIRAQVAPFIRKRRTR